MVGPPEEGDANQRPWLERLREAPKKVLKFLSEAPVACVSNTLAFVKSLLPDAQLDIFAQGMQRTAPRNNSTSTSEKPNL
jgi:hypothetical protein